jgi:hypothetical protein
MLFLLLFIPTTASAYFTMELRSRTEDVSFGNETYVNFTVVNVGNEPGFNVSIELAGGSELTGDSIYIGMLNPKKPFTGSFRAAFAPGIIQGTYPVIITLHYSDRNGYPFTVIFPEDVHYKTKKASTIATNVGTITIPSKGKDYTDLSMEVINYDSKPHNVSIMLYLTNELRANSLQQTLTVPPEGKQLATFGIISATALPASSYSVIAISSYEEDGVHYSNIGLGRVFVTTPSLTTVLNPVLIILAVACIIAIAGVIFYIVKKSRAEQKGSQHKEGPAKESSSGSGKPIEKNRATSRKKKSANRP